MTGFPQIPDFIGLNRPVGIDCTFEDLAIEGHLPAEIEGSFFRAVPDPKFAPLFDDDNALSGDGMISRIRFRDGKADFAIRYVDTARHLAEMAAGRALFGRYRNPFTDDPGVRGVDRTVANTTPVWHAGTLLMTKEDGRPYRIDPDTLETIGRYDFGGALKSETMTAHVRVDATTGEMLAFGYEADGLCSRTIAYFVVGPDGRLTRETWFDAPYCSMMHDFAITEHYALFPVFPTTTDLDRLEAGGEHWTHDNDLESWIGILPRDGTAEDVRWIKGPRGVSVYHIMNAHEGADGRIHLDMCQSKTNIFPFIQRASGFSVPPWESAGGLMRWSFAPDGSGEIDIRPIGPPGDMPRIADRDQGLPYSEGWYLTVDPQQGMPVMGGVVGAMFNALLRIEPETGRIDAMAAGGHALSEPVHIPSATPGHAGWLAMVVDKPLDDDSFEHAVWVVDAGNVAAGPVAKIVIPHRLRPQVHGWWVSAAALDAAA